MLAKVRRRPSKTISLHLDQTFLLGLDTVKQGRIGQLEPVVLSSLESVVGLGFRDCLDEGFEVTTISPEFESVQMKNIGDGVVQEARVVGDND